YGAPAKLVDGEGLRVWRHVAKRGIVRRIARRTLDDLHVVGRREAGRYRARDRRIDAIVQLDDQVGASQVWNNGVREEKALTSFAIGDHQRPLGRERLEVFRCAFGAEGDVPGDAILVDHETEQAAGLSVVVEGVDRRPKDACEADGVVALGTADVDHT